MLKPHRSVILSTAAAVATLLLAASATAAEAEEINLVNNDLGTWRGDTGQWQIVGELKIDPADERRFVTGPGTGVLVNGEAGRTKNLFSKYEHGDIEAHIEFNVPRGSNSGVYFQGRYEVQILDSWGVENPKYGDCGGIYQRSAQGKGSEGHPPRVNASRRPGQWQTFDVVFQAPHFDAQGTKTANAKFLKVVHNGKLVHQNVEVTGPTVAAGFGDEKAMGPLMLQGDHGPVAYRNIRLKPIRVKRQPE
jgi:hypothetical protein